MRALRSGSKELIKEINRYKVLNIIRRKHPISRGEISKLCGLGISTLSYIVEDLKTLGLIFEVEEATSTGGRRAKLIEFNKEFGTTVSVKIEERQILIALSNMAGEIISSQPVPFNKSSSPSVVVKIIEEQILRIFKETGRDLSNLLGVGLLSSGLVNRHDGIIIRSSMLGWENVPITNMLKEKFPDTQIFVDNNINGYTLAELEISDSVEDNNFLVVSIGAGLGLSIVMDRKIYYGMTGGAGEFGHTSIVIDGYPCHCGQKGCLEMYASEFYFENKGRELVQHYPETILKSFQFPEVAVAAEKGDLLAIKLLKEMSQYLGYGIRNLINTFNPDKIVLAGEGAKYKHLFLEDIYEIAEDNFFEKVGIETNIVISKLQDDAWLTGGALLAINHIFQEPIYEKISAEV